MTEQLRVRLPAPVRSVQAVGAPAQAAPGPGGTQTPPEQDAQALQALRQRVEKELADLRRAREALEAGARHLDELWNQLLRETEEQLLDLAVGIAGKVLAQEIQAGRYEIDPIVKEALLQVPPRQEVVVRLNPEDWARCEMAAPSAAAAEAGRVRFVADPTVARAGCVVETGGGIVESTPEAQMQRVKGVLRGEAAPPAG